MTRNNPFVVLNEITATYSETFDTQEAPFSMRPKKEPTGLFVICRFLMQELYIRKAEGAQEEPHGYENLSVTYPCNNCNTGCLPFLTLKLFQVARPLVIYCFYIGIISL